MTWLNARRSVLRFLVGGGATFAMSCGRSANGERPGMTQDLNLAWNAPQNVVAARNQPPPTNLGDPYFRGPALSPDGSLLAVTLPSSPVNELAIVDLKSRTGWVLSHPNNRVKLAHPTFSPDGREIAVIVTPPTYFGSSEIWIAPITGGTAHVIAEQPAACYMSPQFSNDGRHIVCFGDANQSSPQSDIRSYRTGSVQLAVYELEVATGRPSRVVDQAWSWAEYVAYADEQDSFYLRTGLPSQRVADADGSARWTSATNPAAARDQLGRFGFRIRRGEEPPEYPPSAAPEALQRLGAALVGVDDAHGMLWRVPRRNELFAAGSASVLVRCDGPACADMIAVENVHLQESTISRDGRAAVGRIVRRLANDREVVTPAEVHEYAVRNPIGEIETLTLPHDVSFEPQRRPIIAGGPSELAS